MNWYHHRETVDQLAASYLLGTLRGQARRRFDAMLPKQTLLALAVDDWTQRLAPLLTTLAPEQPSPALWKSIALRTAGKGQATAESLWRRVFSAIPAGALAMGVLVGVMAPMLWDRPWVEESGAQLPASYVGVLGTADGKPGLIVSSLRHGAWVDVKQMTPVAVPPGMQLHLWRIDATGKTKALGPLPTGKWVRMALPEPAEALFSQAVELAVTVEKLGDTPLAPQLPFVYRGLCGKLWK